MSRVPLPVVPELPREIQVEVTGACNLRCQMCLVRYRPPLHRVAGSMPLSVFKRIVDGLPALSTVTLQGLGEPLLAPDLFAMIEHASARGVRMGFNTNATLLHRGAAERLVDAGLAWLCISIDGATAATYESIRDGASFDRVERNVRDLVAVKRSRAARAGNGSVQQASEGRSTAETTVRHPLDARDATALDLSIVFVAMRRNVAELPDMVRLAAEWGVPKLRVQNLSHSFDDTDPAGAYREIREFSAREALFQGPDPIADEAFAEARRVAVDLGVALRLPARETLASPRDRGAAGCDWPWRSAYVRHDGKVQPCCMLMGDDRAIQGDLASASFEDLWRGPTYAAFREALLSDEPPAVCGGCSVYRGVF